MCRCGVEDWRGLRLALGFSQRRLAAWLGISLGRLKQLESPNRRHFCPSEASLRWLYVLVRQPANRAKLEGTKFEGLLRRAEQFRLPY